MKPKPHVERVYRAAMRRFALMTPRILETWRRREIRDLTISYLVERTLYKACAAAEKGMPEEPRVFYFVGSLVRYKDGVLQEQIDHPAVLSTPSRAVVLYEDCQAIYDHAAGLAAALTTEVNLCEEQRKRAEQAEAALEAMRLGKIEQQHLVAELRAELAVALAQKDNT